MDKKYLIVAFFLLIILLPSSVYSSETNNSSILQTTANELSLNNLVETLEEYTDEKLDLGSLATDITMGKGINYGLIGNLILNKVMGEVFLLTKNGISILIIIVLMAIIKSIELENNSSINKIASLVGFLVIVIMLINSYLVVLKLFIDTISLLTGIVRTVSPFMMAILIATGAVTTGGVIQPIILFVTSLIGLLVNYVILPMLTVSIIFKIISNISSVIKLEKLGTILGNSSMWLMSVLFALILGVISIEGTITTSVDSVAVKTTQAAVSNLVPVVGKFVSDSLEVIMGASEVIGKTAGVLGIIVIIVITIIPIIKLLTFSVIYYVISALSEALMADEKITKTVEAFGKQYKTMLGILIGVVSIFVISIAVIISLMGKITT